MKISGYSRAKQNFMKSSHTAHKTKNTKKILLFLEYKLFLLPFWTEDPRLNTKFNKALPWEEWGGWRNNQLEENSHWGHS